MNELVIGRLQTAASFLLGLEKFSFQGPLTQLTATLLAQQSRRAIPSETAAKWAHFFKIPSLLQ